MKLSISNIAWETIEMNDHLRLISEYGCDGLELSPSMVWEDPVKVDNGVLLNFKKNVNSFGLEFSSMHSLTYPRPDLVFFDTQEIRNNLISYIIDLGKIANTLEIPVMVFGSAKSRQIGGRNRNECFKIMTDTFGKIAEGLVPLGVKLILEPLSRKETDSIINTDEAMEIIKMVNNPHFALHIDLKSSFAEGEDLTRLWSEHRSYIKHCHVANPGLAPPSSDCEQHYEAAKAIKKSKYNKYISLEIGRNFGNTREVIKKSLEFVKQVYF
jgi:sugar phosphate isomerase/epimerase